MAEHHIVGATPGGPVSAGPEQHLHVDHGSARRTTPAEEAAGLAERAAGVYEGSKERVAEGVEGAKKWAADRYDAARDQVSTTAERTRDYVSDVADRGTARIARQRSRIEIFVAENPALVGVVGLATGLLIGSLLPRTRQEDQAVGAYADEARDQGLRFAREAMHSGRVYVEAALDQANEALGQADEAVRQDLGGGEVPGGVRSGPSGRYQNH